MKKNLAVKLLASLPFIAVFSLGQSASANTYDWTFTNQDGTGEFINYRVSGFVVFDNGITLSSQNNVSAVDLQITEITNDVNNITVPFFGDGGIELNTNLIGGGTLSSNQFDFNASSEIIASQFVSEYIDNNSDTETLRLDSGSLTELENLTPGLRGGGITVELSDNDADSLVFTGQAASVPFEFSPTWGIFLVGSVFGFARYQKYRQLNQLSQ